MKILVRSLKKFCELLVFDTRYTSEKNNNFSFVLTYDDTLTEIVSFQLFNSTTAVKSGQHQDLFIFQDKRIEFSLLPEIYLRNGQLLNKLLSNNYSLISGNGIGFFKQIYTNMVYLHKLTLLFLLH